MYAWTPLEVSTRLKGMSGLCTSTTTKPQEKTQKGKQKKNKIGESAFSQTADVKTSFRILTSPKPQLLTAQNWGGEKEAERSKERKDRAFTPTHFFAFCEIVFKFVCGPTKRNV